MVLDVSPSLSIAVPLKKNMTVCQVAAWIVSTIACQLTIRFVFLASKLRHRWGNDHFLGLKCLSNFFNAFFHPADSITLHFKDSTDIKWQPIH